jgi:NAD-dependent protein deacetylases, SIR2 family
MKYKEFSAIVLAESSLYLIFSLCSLRSSDVYRHESSRCCSLPFFLTLSIISPSRFSFYINNYFTLNVSENILDSCDLCLVIGTSSVVYPAAMFAPQVAQRGVPVAEFNIEKTPATFRFQ